MEGELRVDVLADGEHGCCCCSGEVSMYIAVPEIQRVCEGDEVISSVSVFLDAIWEREVMVS